MSLSMAPERCAPASERRGDPLFATAAPAERFLLVEQPGAWGRRALRESRLDAPTMAALIARCHAVDARLLLIRRAHRDPAARKRWAVVDARPGSERSWWGEFDEEAELADLDPAQPGGAPTSDPLFLVCTHGRRDPCCAGRGWPVAVALTEAFPEQTWQCSHVGGDRFAANVVILPHGFYYGRLTPATAPDVARRHAAGLVTTDSLRGRSCFPPAVQAAQHYARLRLDTDAIDALHPREALPGDDGRVRVRLAFGDGTITVDVRERESDPIPRLTCGARIATPMRVWELLALEDARG
jgi:Sucrase/ferredoxin-like